MSNTIKTADHRTVQVGEKTAAAARAILERKIETGRAAAMTVFERINQQAPRDAIVKGSAIHFGIAKEDVVNPAIGLSLGKSDKFLGIHRHALGQFAGRAGIPSAYLQTLASEPYGSWQRSLAVHTLTQHYHQGDGATRFLVRQVDGDVRGFLSDKFRRLDSRPLVDAFAKECQKIGAVPVDGTCSDVRVAMKAIVPKIYEPVPGEVIAFGLEWSNSDFGAALHAIRAFILRVWCLNGATMENVLAQVHLGSKLGDDIELSQRTYELDTATSISALRDVVAGTLAPGKIEALCDGIRAANEKQIEWHNVQSRLAKKLLKGELEKARDAFKSEDVVNLPAGNTMWRASNALSWIAGQTDDADRKLELQRFAGELVHGKKEELLAA